MKIKFEVGQKVKCLDGEVGEVLGFSYSQQNGVIYTISSKEVDLEKKEIINGVKTMREDELEAVKGTKKGEDDE